jgi:eukaryotic-like serine/threonine-protein kinase
MTFRFSPFLVDPEKRTLLRGGLPVSLTPKTFDILVFFLTHRDRVVSKEELLSQLWPDTAVEEATLAQHVYLLRRALNDSEEGARYIETVPRRGYRFVASVSERDDPPPERAEASGRRSSNRRWVWAVAAAFLPIAAVLVAVLRYREPFEPSALRFTIAPPAGTRFSGVALSPDGQTIVFRAVTREGTSLLWIRRLDSLTAHPLKGTEDGAQPFWSPNGRHIGFFAGGKLKKVKAENGAPDVICDAPNPRGGSWGKDDTIVFAPDSRSGLARVPATGGIARSITTLIAADRITSHRWPQFLPDSRRFLFVQMAGDARQAGVFVGSIDGAAPVRLLPDVSNAVYAREGYVLFSRGDALVAQPFDAVRLRLTGDPVVVAEGVGRLVTMYAPFSIAENQRLIYEGHDPRSRFVWLDRTGREIGTVGRPARQGDPALSRDGSRVLSWKGDVDAVDIWIDDLARGTSSRLTFTGQDIVPVWSADEKRAIFRSNRNGPGDLYLKDLTHSDREELLLRTPFRKEPTDWSPDGQYLLFDNYDNTDTTRPQPDMCVLSLHGDHVAARYQDSPFTRWSGRFSPDGRWIAFAGDETGRPEVYVQAFPANNVRWRVSINGGDQPQWRQDGRELFFVSADESLCAVQVSHDGAALRFTSPRPLFKMRAKHSGLRNTYAVSGDGERFLVDTPVEDPAAVPLTVVTSWLGGIPR